MRVKITSEEIRKLLDIETPEFPKYVSPLINLANQYAQVTRPKVVGKMSELKVNEGLEVDYGELMD